MPSEAHVYENTTELGEDRVPAPAPSVEFLADLGNHLNISQHATPPVFTEACNDLCRFGYDHPDVVGTVSVLESLFMALKYRPDNDDEDEGMCKSCKGLNMPLTDVGMAELESCTARCQQSLPRAKQQSLITARLSKTRHGSQRILDEYS